ncbi:MAG: IS200/IS605 family transposase [Armatimonadetes bacterium]|nr:IS200/IS605 family transposase [Armatimonadota bacterium]
MPLPNSKSEIYLHFVWATKGRLPLLVPEIRRPVYRCIGAEVAKLGCVLLALGGTEDHVHMLVRTPAKVCASSVAQRVKGVSSYTVSETRPAAGGFYWQPGYGVFSAGADQLDRIAAYIAMQEEHHRRGNVEAFWERCGDAERSAPH